MINQIKTLPLEDYEIHVVGYHDILRLTGLIFLERGFVARVDARGIDAVLAEMGSVDLDVEQAVTFVACFKNLRLREVVVQWWHAYDEGRKKGEIPQAEPYWTPNRPTGYQDIVRLSGLVFFQQNFIARVDALGLDAMIAMEAVYGDLTALQRATFTAAFYNSHLRDVVENWWFVYEEERSLNHIP